MEHLDQYHRGVIAEKYKIPLTLTHRQGILKVWDLLAVNGGIGATLLRYTPLHQQSFVYLLFYSVGWSLLWLLWAQTLDAYAVDALMSWDRSIRRALVAGLFTFSLVLAWLWLRYPTLPHFADVTASLGVTLIALLLGRGAIHMILSHPRFRTRVLLIGQSEALQAAQGALRRAHTRIYEQAGVLQTDALHGQNGGVATPVSAPSSRSDTPYADNPQPSFSTTMTVLQMIQKCEADLVVVAEPDPSVHHEIERLCRDLGLQTVPLDQWYEHLTGQVWLPQGISQSEAMNLLGAHPLNRPWARFLKRSFDLFWASVGAICLLPLIPWIALAIYLDSRGPIFYLQDRVGRWGRVFQIFKFRTMVPNAEQGRAVWAQENDPRVTRVGKILRKLHLDEFPQFFNILRGEMSVVGPRPERPEFVEELAQEMPAFRVRHEVKPGMAGWALVNYGYASSKEDSLAKLAYDLYYIKHWSLWKDFVILMKTFVDSLTLRGRA